MSVSLKFAIPAGPLFANLADRAGTHRIITAANEQECAALLKNHRVDAALISPLHYGLAATGVDYKIVPATGIFLEGFTDIASIWFMPGLKEIRRIVSSSSNNFVATAGRIILAERYAIHPELVETEPDNLLASFMAEGCAIGYREEISASPSLDISEDWLDIFEAPLPIAVWACRQDDDAPSELPDILLGLAKEGLAEEIAASESCCDAHDHSHSSERNGVIRLRWNPSALDALETTFDLLYYHQYLPEIPEAKLWIN